MEVQNIEQTVANVVNNVLDSKLQTINTIPELLTARETSQYYGQSEGYWKKQIFHRNINFVKMGKSVKLKKSDIEQFIADRTVEVA